MVEQARTSGHASRPICFTTSFVKTFFLLLVRAYQMTLGHVLPATCRYYPSCSTYAIEALEKHGAMQGGWLAVRRIGRCHPFRPGGYDPVP